MSAAADRSNPRAHAYLAAGLWAGAAVLIATLRGDDGYAMLVDQIALKLDKDAVFAGVDRKVAGALRAISATLKSGQKLTSAARCAAVQVQMQRLLDYSRI